MSSLVLSSNDGVKARKQYTCDLCGEEIWKGEKYDRRSGCYDDGMWTMHMHPECHVHEQKDGTVDPDWYEDISGPAFRRPKP